MLRLLVALILVGFIVSILALTLRSIEDRKEGADLIGLLLYYLMIVAVAGCFVAIPGIVASRRKHPNAAAIWVLTILFGWTFLGWGIALIWAMTNPPHRGAWDK